MKNKNLIFLGFIFLFGILIINLVGSADVSYCCEKLKNGLWCQNAPEEDCDTSGDLKAQPTSCESTSYCKLGCCFNSAEGNCLPNTAQKTCESKGGIWQDDAQCEIAQCNLGCCLIGDQSAFVTQTRCKRLSFLYGLEINFRTDITSELECTLSTTSSDTGACVYEEDYSKTCKFTTQKDCKSLESSFDSVSFHKGYLCTDESLGTDCSMSEDTTCVDGEDEVYFVDSCGNLANIYDSTKAKDKTYWSKVVKKEDSCKLVLGKNQKTCGNCDYYSGSICSNYEKGDEVVPAIGDNVCIDLSCDYDTNMNDKIDSDEHYAHGEQWCSTNAIEGEENSPGSRYFKLLCYNGEVSVEPCEEFRNEICIESEVNDFKTASCKVNRWHDCIKQTTKDDCENDAKRDCVWFGLKNNKLTDVAQACIPKYAPGFDFYNTENEKLTEICALGDASCLVKYEKGLNDDKWECVENCHCCFDDGSKYHTGCTGDRFWQDKELVCQALGDCGSSLNYFGIKGYQSKSSILKSNP